MTLLARLINELNALKAFIRDEQATHKYNYNVFRKRITDLELKNAELEQTTRAQEREITRLIGERDA